MNESELLKNIKIVAWGKDKDGKIKQKTLTSWKVYKETISHILDGGEIELKLKNFVVGYGMFNDSDFQYIPKKECKTN